MLWDASAIKGYEVEASDGQIGTVSDLLFEDVDWVLRWLVVDVGHWLAGRKVLLPLSVLGPLNAELRHIKVRLTKQQVEASPDIDTDLPVSRQIEAKFDSYYSWTPYPGGGELPLSNAMALPFVEPLPFFETRLRDLADVDADLGKLRDPHLRSITSVTGYHIHATDGEIGHVEDFLVDDSDWSIRYIAVDTRNWWPGESVLISPRSVETIDWADASIHTNIDRQKIKDSPRHDPAVTIDGTYDEKFLSYYGIKWTKK